MTSGKNEILTQDTLESIYERKSTQNIERNFIYWDQIQIKIQDIKVKYNECH